MMPATMSALSAIARCTMLEAWRGRLPWVLGALAAAALGMAGFARQLALIEGDALHSATLAALLRLGGVLSLAVFAVISVQREEQGRGLHLLLAMALPRSAYVAGKFAGLALLALPVAFASCALLLACAAAQPAQVLLWSVSLVCELWLAAGFALLCALALPHALPALAATLGLYLLARTAGALQLAAAHSLRPQDGWQHVLALGMDAVAALLPRLDLYTRASWLVYGDGSWPQLAAIAGQTAVYLVLLGAAALFDFYRKNL